jgi:hypothetical protein
MTHTPSPHFGWQVPFWHGKPVVQVPQDRPQLSLPQVAPLQLGMQQLPCWQIPPPHPQSCGHVVQFSLV